MRGIAAALHHGNADGAVNRNVGDGASGNHTEESGRDDGNFRRSAPVSPHGDQGKVNEKFVTPNSVERLTEKNKGDQNGRCDIERHAENTTGIEIKISCDPSPR